MSELAATPKLAKIPAPRLGRWLLLALLVWIVAYALLGLAIYQIFSAGLTAGVNAIAWDGADDLGRPLPGGVYVCRVVAGEESASTRFVLLR